MRALLAGALLAASGLAHAQSAVLVFAAASLKNALDAVAAGYGARAPVVVSYAGSPALARQIERGAPAEIFISADRDWMDHLEREGRIVAASRRDLLGNRLVLIAPAARPVSLQPAPGFPLAAALGGGRIALAAPDTVPAGKYARAALEALGVWPQVRDRVAAAENVRAALALVARGEAPLGIVYRTDAQVEPRVVVAGAFPAGSHPPIVYPAALVKGADARAAAFLEYLGGPAARAVFVRYGFTVD